ncbi:MAG: PEGA domain-containing protein [Bacteroidales bacterium]|nr:PEGA domain-containing protein [Bacteroidales bacterium]
MKYLLTIILVLSILPLAADEFVVLSFQKAANDISAITIKNKRTDDNDELCAIIKVRSDLQNLRFTASTPIVGSVEWINGEYWVYLSAGTRQLDVFTEGFIKFSYTFPERIEMGSVYILALSSKTGGNVETGKGSLNITSTPENITVGIDGFPDLFKETPCSFEDYRVGNYQFTFRRSRYHPLDSIITIEDKTQKQINVTLRPKWGNLSIVTNTEETSFTINGRNYTGKNLLLKEELNGLDPGDYIIDISKEKYKPQQLNITIKEGDNQHHEINLIPITTSLIINSIPSGAAILIDETAVGSSPYSGQWIIGSHNLQVSKEGYITEELVIELSADKANQQTITLKSHAKIKIESDPSGASVSINGKNIGKTPLHTEVVSGENHLELSKENYITKKARIVIKASDTYSYILEKQNYQLKVSSDPADANIVIYGESKGRTPKELDLVSGRYKITIEKDQYFRRTKRVNLTTNERLSVKLIKRLKGSIGGNIGLTENGYETAKLGFDLGWTYAKANRLYTGIGINYGITEKIEEHNRYTEKIIERSAYAGLNLTRLETDGFVETKMNTYYARLGVVISRPSLVLHLNFGLSDITGYEVYVADGTYKSKTKADLNLGNQFIDLESKIDKTSTVYGVGMILPLGEIYLSADYWVSNNFVNYSPKYMIGVGLLFK